jgi:hypothetical protein
MAGGEKHKTLHPYRDRPWPEMSRRSKSTAPRAAMVTATMVTPMKESGSMPSSIALP